MVVRGASLSQTTWEACGRRAEQCGGQEEEGKVVSRAVREERHREGGMTAGKAEIKVKEYLGRREGREARARNNVYGWLGMGSEDNNLVDIPLDRP